MADRPKVQIVRPDDTDAEVYVNGKHVDTIRWQGIGSAVNDMVTLVKDVALALGADVEDASEPDRQPYRYFITFTATGRITWQQPWRAILRGTVQAGAWFDLDKDIDGPEDTQRIAESLAARYPDPTIVIITGITYVDGPC